MMDCSESKVQPDVVFPTKGSIGGGGQGRSRWGGALASRALTVFMLECGERNILASGSVISTDQNGSHHFGGSVILIPRIVHLASLRRRFFDADAGVLKLLGQHGFHPSQILVEFQREWLMAWMHGATWYVIAGC